jgi:hypothetical protein
MFGEAVADVLRRTHLTAAVDHADPAGEALSEGPCGLRIVFGRRGGLR